MRGVGGNYLPSAIEEFENEMAEIDENDTKAVEFGNTALYAPVSYLPQVIGIKIADLFTDKCFRSVLRGGDLLMH